MKRKSLKVAGATAPKPTVMDGGEATHREFPPPELLLKKALAVPNRKLIEDYRETIRILRDEKRLGYREIADWLTENGVPADHNSVYRAYTKHLQPHELAEVEEREIEEARENQESERPS